MFTGKYTMVSGSSRCSACHQGHYRNAGQPGNKCQLCPTGKFQRKSGATLCNSCPPDSLCTDSFLQQVESATSSDEGDIDSPTQSPTIWNGKYGRSNSIDQQIRNVRKELAEARLKKEIKQLKSAPSDTEKEEPATLKKAGVDVSDGQGNSVGLGGALLANLQKFGIGRGISTGPSSDSAHTHHFQQHQPKHRDSMPTSAPSLATPKPTRQPTVVYTAVRTPTGSPTEVSPGPASPKYNVCAPGKFLADPILCLPCPAGRYQPYKSSSTRCLACVTARDQTQKGATNCGGTSAVISSSIGGKMRVKRPHRLPGML